MITQNKVLIALNSYVEDFNKKFPENKLSKSENFEIFIRLPQVMAAALWAGDNAENNEKIKILIEAYDLIIKKKNIPS